MYALVVLISGPGERHSSRSSNETVVWFIVGPPQSNPIRLSVGRMVHDAMKMIYRYILQIIILFRVFTFILMNDLISLYRVKVKLPIPDAGHDTDYRIR